MVLLLIKRILFGIGKENFGIENNGKEIEEEKIEERIGNEGG